MPVITNLRNPALKPRHWEHIQQIFGYHFTEEEPLTLGLLNKIDAFDHTEAIEEVSGQASSEASLEGILKKVCLRISVTIIQDSAACIFLVLPNMEIINTQN